MHGIILAAGRGSRLGRLTEDKPKCLVELHGRPLLEWQIDALNKGGVEDISLVGGYQSQHLRHYGYPITQNDRWEESNMVVSLLSASPILEKNGVIISYSDIFYPASVIRSLIDFSGDIVVAQASNWRDLWTKRFDNPLSDAETFMMDKQGYITEIGNKANSLDEIQGQFMGVFKITPKGWSIISQYLSSLSSAQVDVLDVTKLLSGLILKGCRINSVPCNEAWGEVDKQSDLALYERIFSEQNMR